MIIVITIYKIKIVIMEIVTKLLFVCEEESFFKKDVFDYVILYSLCPILHDPI